MVAADARRLAGLAVALAGLGRAADGARGPWFPYVPTQLLAPAACVDGDACRGRDVVFVLAPASDGVEMLAFDVGAGLDSSTRPSPVAARLPFLWRAGPMTAFGAVRAADGTVLVHAGACDAANGAHVWSFDPAGRLGARSSPLFLGATLAFSPQLAPAMDQPTLYTYGGMCAEPRAEPGDWQSAARYSRAMVSLAPDSRRPDTGYAAGVASLAGLRVPFAGFSLTPLPPSVTNVLDVLAQQASFVLLDGHSQAAFINMSTAAVWSLPAESWSYVAIRPPAQEPAAVVDSRSGHTAVLSEDGRTVVVLGGWVGDVDTPAEPQLVVLEMSQAYSSWRWSVPARQPAGPGIYGHGAAVLPGNVMMVYGGWQTRARGAAHAKRHDDVAATPRFLNLTSMTWASSYRNPRAGASARDARRLGLGLGLAVAVALGLVVLLYAWRRRRLRRRQALRDEAIRAMADDAKRFLSDDGEPDGRDDWRAPASPGRPADAEPLLQLPAPAMSRGADDEERQGQAADGRRRSL